MAKKAKIRVKDSLGEYEELDGYQVDENLGLVQMEGNWVTIHLRTGNRLAGKQGVFKQKRQCLAYAEHLAQGGVAWAFDTEEEMVVKNDRQVLSDLYIEAVEKGRAA